MQKMYLDYFRRSSEFPFCIQFGTHDEGMFVHTHDDFSELVIILEGSAVHIVGKQRYHIGKGDVFVISHDTAHGYEEAVNFRICNIMFRLEELFPKYYDIWKLSGFHALFVLEPYMSKDQKFMSRLHLSYAQITALEIRLREMVNSYFQQEEGMETELRAKMAVIALELSREYGMNQQVETSPLIHLASAIAYIEKHYQETITMSMLARLTNLSVRQFSRLFCAVYQESPGKYLQAFRINKAMNLLRLTSLSITEVATRCGFGDGNYFSRQFHIFTGISPREFRKKESELLKELD